MFHTAENCVRGLCKGTAGGFQNRKEIWALLCFLTSANHKRSWKAKSIAELYCRFVKFEQIHSFPAVRKKRDLWRVRC